MSDKPDDADTNKMTLTATDIGLKCPCGAAVAVSDGKRPAVLHGMPMCKDFKKRDPITYLRWLNEQRLEAVD